MFPGTGTSFGLCIAGHVAEIGSGSSHVVNISLKLLLPDKLIGLRQYGLVASGLYDPALMKSQRTKTAAPKTARLLTRLYFTSSMAGTPCLPRRRGDRCAYGAVHTRGPSQTGSKALRADSVPQKRFSP